MMASSVDEPVRELARRVWRYRLDSELEAAHRFRRLAPQMRALGVSEAIVGMAERAAADELRHATLCQELIHHFGGTSPSGPPVASRPVAPSGLDDRQRVFYELVALCCVTETLSTALLGELVTRARDPVCKQVMRTILRDEVNHSRLGWAFLADNSKPGTRDCVGPYLPQLLDATLGDDFFQASDAPDARLKELAGLGSLERPERQRIVKETLVQVVFPGLERFGIETALGRRWLGN